MLRSTTVSSYSFRLIPPATLQRRLLLLSIILVSVVCRTGASLGGGVGTIGRRIRTVSFVVRPTGLLRYSSAHRRLASSRNRWTAETRSVSSLVSNRCERPRRPGFLAGSHRTFCSTTTTSLPFSHRGSTNKESVMVDPLPNHPVTHVPDHLLPPWLLKGRTRVLNRDDMSSSTMESSKKSSSSPSTVVYWMQRDVRTADNWALLLAAHLASEADCRLRVVYALPRILDDVDTDENNNNNNNTDDTLPDLEHLPMTERHGSFLLGGLECVHSELKDRHIPLHVVIPTNDNDDDAYLTTLVDALTQDECVTVVTDFTPLRHVRDWTEDKVGPQLDVRKLPLYQVDAHNVVPVWMASDKREYAARTIRTKIQKQYDTYLQKFPKLSTIALKHNLPDDANNTLPTWDRSTYETALHMDPSVPALDWAQPGTKAALAQAEKFFSRGLPTYADQRNDPNQPNVCSTISPWLNHGHVSFQRLALAVKKLNKHGAGTAAFVEEGVVRRELSDNFCYYARHDYDKLSAAYDWARESLGLHATDDRTHVYTCHELAEGQTHDDLWNAAQLQAVRDGKMHGFLRMYWAKKILEWTPSPEAALEIAQYLNDKYNLDGRDPNGFVGVGWSIMGIHDQGWKERDVFGKIRYMNYAGCKRKFKIPQFVSRYKGASANAERAMVSQQSKVSGQKHMATVSASKLSGLSKKTKKK